jgi:hypothetical protein
MLYLCMCVLAFMHGCACIYAWVCLHLCMRVLAFMQACACIYACVCLHLCMRVLAFMHACTCIYAGVCLHLCISATSRTLESPGPMTSCPLPKQANQHASIKLVYYMHQPEPSRFKTRHKNNTIEKMCISAEFRTEFRKVF